MVIHQIEPGEVVPEGGDDPLESVYEAHFVDQMKLPRSVLEGTAADRREYTIKYRFALMLCPSRYTIQVLGSSSICFTKAQAITPTPDARVLGNLNVFFVKWVT